MQTQVSMTIYDTYAYLIIEGQLSKYFQLSVWDFFQVGELP